jgi:hypothetical protein
MKRHGGFPKFRTNALAGAGALLALAATAFGCAVAPPPIATTPPVVTTPLAGEVSVALQKAQTVGDVVPVYVSVSNGTDVTRVVYPGQIFAINETGQRVAPLPPGEAARRAGDAGELRAVLASATVSGVGGGAVGAGLGAAVGSVTGGAARGAVIGSAIGAAHGIFRGAELGQSKAEREAREQIGALAMHHEEVRPNFTVSGYVFFPAGSYRNVKMILVNRETHDTETIDHPWP